MEWCHNYEVFHLVLTYMYTGKISLDKHNVDDILDISHSFSILKLKNYAAEYLEKMLRANNCLKIIEQSTKYHLSDLSKHTMTFINKNFKYIVQYHEIEKMSITVFQEFLNKAYYFQDELILRFITHWVSQEKSGREENFATLLHNVTWASLDPAFIFNHLEEEELFYSSPESLLTILRLLDSNNIVLNQKLTKAYHDLQDREEEREKIDPDTVFQHELEDNNSFLSIAINSAVKDLEHQEVDETFSSYILQPDPYAPFRHPSGQEQGVVQSTDTIGMVKPYMSPTNLVKPVSLERQKQNEEELQGIQASRYQSTPNEPIQGSPYQNPTSEPAFQPEFPPGPEYRGMVPGAEYRESGSNQEYREVDYKTNATEQQQYRTPEQEYRGIPNTGAEYRSALTIGNEYRSGNTSEAEYRDVVATETEYRGVVPAETEYRSVVTTESEYMANDTLPGITVSTEVAQSDESEYRSPKEVTGLVSSRPALKKEQAYLEIDTKEQTYMETEAKEKEYMENGAMEQDRGCRPDQLLQDEEETPPGRDIVARVSNKCSESSSQVEPDGESEVPSKHTGGDRVQTPNQDDAQGNFRGSTMSSQDYRVTTPPETYQSCQATVQEDYQNRQALKSETGEYRAAGQTTSYIEEQFRPPSCGQPLPPEPEAGKNDCRVPDVEVQFQPSPGPQYPAQVEEYPGVGEQYRPVASCPNYPAPSPAGSHTKLMLPQTRPKELQPPEQSSARNSPLSGGVSHVPSPGDYRDTSQCLVPDYYRGEGQYQGDRTYFREEVPRTLYDGTVYRSCYPGMEQYRGSSQYSEAYRVEERGSSEYYREQGEARHRMDRLPSRTDFDFSTEYSILEQVINEHQKSEAASGEFTTGMPTTKRYDPKHRALAEAFRQMEAEMADQTQPVPSYAMEAHCGTARPDQTCRNSSQRESGPDCQYARGEGRRALATPVPDPEFIERPEVPPPALHPPQVTTEQVAASPPPSLLHLASCAQEPLATPEKVESPVSPPLLTPRTRTSSSKTEAQQMFLTPKEKYAKGVSARTETTKLTVPCDLNQENDVPKENKSPEPEPLVDQSTPPVKRIKITMAHIVRAKKKMASQKKLILEHGEVRLTQRQRLRMRPAKKKVTRKLQANDVFHSTESPKEPEGKVSTETELANDPDDPVAPMKKRIVNRKDKLLAEHRSQSLHLEEADGDVKTPSKKVFTCPICGVETSTGKDHFQHIKVLKCCSICLKLNPPSRRST